MPSYERINYLLRPNKSVERKMVCDILSRISTIKNLTEYQYIGFGSTYFADFSLFHRELGISQMISIEGVAKAKKRCEFNKPFACIELKMGDSSTVLPNLDINKKDSIIWLDYDGGIADYIFSDINTVITTMRPGSFFMLSINSELYKKDLSDEEIRQEIVNNIGEDRFPKIFADVRMNNKTYQELLYRCLADEIKNVVQNRQGLGEAELTFHQAVYFVYKDGARMMTIGGFLFKKEEEVQYLSKLSLAQFPFYRNDNQPFNIQCPVLSLKEIQALNTYLPCEIVEENGKMTNKSLEDFPVENKDIKSYSSLYRYYPNFTETLI